MFAANRVPLQASRKGTNERLYIIYKNETQYSNGNGADVDAVCIFTRARHTAFVG